METRTDKGTRGNARRGQKSLSAALYGGGVALTSFFALEAVISAGNGSPTAVSLAYLLLGAVSYATLWREGRREWRSERGRGGGEP